MKYYTLDQVAEELSVAPQTVRAWVRTGQLRGAHLAGNKMLRFSEDDVKAFYDSKATTERA